MQNHIKQFMCNIYACLRVTNVTKSVMRCLIKNIQLKLSWELLAQFRKKFFKTLQQYKFVLDNKEKKQNGFWKKQLPAILPIFLQK